MFILAIVNQLAFGYWLSPGNSLNLGHTESKNTQRKEGGRPALRARQL